MPLPFTAGSGSGAAPVTVAPPSVYQCLSALPEPDSIPAHEERQIMVNQRRPAPALPRTQAGDPGSSPKTITSAELFGSTRLLIIRHAGEEYRLSITSKDKLILTK